MSAAAPPAGLVVVDKPGGMTSHDVVARVRRLAGTRKVGHAGTLDPMATGVLVLGVNRATRLLGHLMLTEKAYDATIRLGVATTTDDAEGEVVATVSDRRRRPRRRSRAALAEFVGDIEQVPTAVSAIKVDGKRAYQRVRDGEQVELPARPVTVHELVVHDVRRGRRRSPRRRRLGALLQRHLHPRDRPRPRRRARRRRPPDRAAAYRRRAVRPRPRPAPSRSSARSFALLPIADAARAGFPARDLDEAQAARRPGRARRSTLALDGLTAVFAPDGEFLALYEPRDGVARPVAVFV